MKYFDGHNDVLLKFYFEKNKDSAKEFFNGNDFCHIDFPKILKSNFAVVFLQYSFQMKSQMMIF